MKPVCLAIVAAALAASVVPASAGGPEPAEAPRARIFSVHDLDRDGRLSRDEYRQFTEYRQRWGGRGRWRDSEPIPFEAIDGDRDGFIGEDELVAALAARLPHHGGGRRYRGGRGGER
jgi:hypothetical protein